MAELAGLVVSYVVGHVAGVPDDHVVIADRFAVDEAVEVRFSDATESARGAVDAIIQLVSVITQNPNVAARNGLAISFDIFAAQLGSLFATPHRPSRRPRATL